MNNYSDYSEAVNRNGKEFELVVGVNAGYNHDNQEQINFCKLYREKIAEVAAKTGIYVTAVINESRAVYPTAFGCPIGGEVVYTVRGTWNPEFAADFGRYRKAIELMCRILAHNLNQSTFTLTWKEAVTSYFRKV